MIYDVTDDVTDDVTELEDDPLPRVTKKAVNENLAVKLK